MDPQPRQLRALVAVVDAGTFTGAAAELGVSQASVSRAIAALEATMGVRLLQRTTRHVALTATGRQVLEGARRILDEITHLRRIAERRQDELRVGYAWAARPPGVVARRSTGPAGGSDPPEPSRLRRVRECRVTLHRLP
ncbi:LysR family transcriptional regulator [Actinoplanes derwentensis]|uniref:Regulatory helix-turn-helix protein, lysR family n=1 Tax=Actinoplanes derwentensis TaxID=113562 RepID=A0A1H1WRQ1_9ACTN|nr:LysR family transcriptional regulator [Actinoplanes derwentensis]GID87013.1 hypothetical protein Ade03nite_59370 [Actinoplanes derwentensis]SDS99340.1 regulatory helix-turn-helix protein, lysR family [Actinoplanes derwentensis]